MGAAGPVLAALATDKPGSWMDLAACKEVDPDIFHPEQGESNRPAKKICAGCFVSSQCLEYALATNQEFGIWGGTSEHDRRRIKEAAA